jgi:hypothetical protein
VEEEEEFRRIPTSAALLAEGMEDITELYV